MCLPCNLTGSVHRSDGGSASFMRLTTHCLPCCHHGMMLRMTPRSPCGCLSAPRTSTGHACGHNTGIGCAQLVFHTPGRLRVCVGSGWEVAMMHSLVFCVQVRRLATSQQYCTASATHLSWQETGEPPPSLGLPMCGINICMYA